jgi:2-oxoglutarate dehydrogenase E1 component
MIEAPIFHVNGDDPEAVVYAAKVATEFRRSSASLLSSTCSAIAASATTRRRAGVHPAEDVQADPHHETVVTLYSRRLIEEGVITEGEFDGMKADFRKRIWKASSTSADSYKPNKADWLDGRWSGLRTADNQDEQRRGKTGVECKG